MNTDFDVEKYRVDKYQEASEAWNKLESERLKDIHLNMWMITEKIKAGDRFAMLELLETTADTLLVFDELSPEIRKNLTIGLKDIVNELKSAKGFLPKGRGKRTEEQINSQECKSFKTAMKVEFLRNEHCLTLEVAKEEVANCLGITESVVHKCWKKSHRKAKEFFDATENVSKIVNETLKKVR